MKNYSVDITRVKEYKTYAQTVTGPIVYFMQRDQRVHDNWALLYAQEKAREYSVPLMVVIVFDPQWAPRTVRHFDFMRQGLQEVYQELHKYSIACNIEIGSPEKIVPAFVKKYKASGVVTDFSPLRYHQNIIKKLHKKITCALHEIDAHNIVPCWIASSKQEYAARTLRTKLHKHLKHYMTEFPKVKKQSGVAIKKIDIHWDAIQKKLYLDTSVESVQWIKPGEKGAKKMLKDFIQHRLHHYNQLRNDPTQYAQSELSPYIHFGHISAQRIALEVSKQSGFAASKKDFLEELIVRKELSDNYCYYNNDYDSISGAPEWAQKTLQKHAQDRREYIYTKQQLEKAQTHDELWNAAQLQLVYHGKMHGYMRMYWAKKILEWTTLPKKAFQYAIEFNDTYSLDGTDPNGYVGVAWSIAGVHDRPWFERKIFGTIRYMSYNGCKSKFNIAEYCKKIQNIMKKKA